MGQAGYKKLIAWQKADQLTKEVYKKTKNFPKDEQYGVRSQLRRSTLSVPTNIVEGYSRSGNKELRQFLNIALGSLSETEYLLDFCYDLEYFSKDDHCLLQGIRQEVGNLLWKFYQSI